MSSKALDIKNPYKDLLDNSHIDIGVSELKKNDKAAGSFSERFSRSVCQRALRCKALGKALYWSRSSSSSSRRRRRRSSSSSSGSGTRRDAQATQNVTHKRPKMRYTSDPRKG